MPLNYKKSPIAKLKAVAKSLPDLYEPAPTPVFGKELIAQGQKLDGLGKPLLPNSVYTVKRPKKVNHLEELKKVYKSGGDDAVSHYSVEVVKKVSENNKKKPPVINTI